MRYVLDTSALVDAWNKWYSPDTIPGVWDNLEDLGRSAQLTIPDAVLLELQIHDDALYRWCRDRKDFICTASSQEIQELVKEICDSYPNLRKAGTPSKNFADPIVIAVAEHFGSAVVTHEIPTGNLNGPRIPDVCKDRGIRVLQFHRLVREQGWTFG